MPYNQEKQMTPDGLDSNNYNPTLPDVLIEITSPTKDQIFKINEKFEFEIPVKVNLSLNNASNNDLNYSLFLKKDGINLFSKGGKLGKGPFKETELTFSINIDAKNGDYKLFFNTEVDGKEKNSSVDFKIENVIQNSGNILAEKDTSSSTEYLFQAPQLQTFLYKNSKNKILFKIDKFFPLPRFQYFADVIVDNDTIEISGVNLDKYKYNTIEYNFLTGLNANIFKTDTRPKISKIDDGIKEITNEKNLYKTLNSDNGNFSFEGLQEVDKDFYYAVEVYKEAVWIDGIQQQIIDSLNGPFFSEIQRIRVIKDGDLYFLEKETLGIDNSDNIKTKIFSNKLFIEPKNNVELKDTFQETIKSIINSPFAPGDSSFDSGGYNFPYVKVRITSKKTNRKIDLNLKYTFLQYIKELKFIEELNGKNYEEIDSTKQNNLDAINKSFADILEKYNKPFNTAKEEIEVLLTTFDLASVVYISILEQDPDVKKNIELVSASLNAMKASFNSLIDKFVENTIIDELNGLRKLTTDEKLYSAVVKKIDSEIKFINDFISKVKAKALIIFESIGYAIDAQNYKIDTDKIKADADIADKIKADKTKDKTKAFSEALARYKAQTADLDDFELLGHMYAIEQALSFLQGYCKANGDGSLPTPNVDRPTEKSTAVATEYLTSLNNAYNKGINGCYLKLKYLKKIYNPKLRPNIWPIYWPMKGYDS